MLVALFKDNAIIQTTTLSYQQGLVHKRSSYWCGAWTPYGNLGHTNYNKTYIEPLLAHVVCKESSVGQEYVPNTTQLFCHPNLTGGGRAPSVIALDLQRLSGDDSQHQQPEYSIIVPSHNAAETLQQTAPTLCQNTMGYWEVVHILDGSWDNSLQVLEELFMSELCLNNGGLLRARVLIQPTGIWETASDNVGFTLTNPSHAYIEVQADMYLTEQGWNRRLVRPFLQYGDILSVSGRCGHANTRGIGPSVGRCGANVQALNAKMENDTRDTVLITATNNRGPWALRPDALRLLGHLDELAFYLGDDDHDLNRRAMFWGLHAAYTYVAFYAPLDLSPQRNQELKAKIPASAQAHETAYLQWRHNEISKKQCENAIAGFDARTPTGPWERRPLQPIPRQMDWNAALPPLAPLLLNRSYRE